jgi:hypothetical protein
MMVLVLDVSNNLQAMVTASWVTGVGGLLLAWVGVLGYSAFLFSPLHERHVLVMKGNDNMTVTTTRALKNEARGSTYLE